MDLYDDFEAEELDAAKWQMAAAPLGEGKFWHWRDDAAKVACGGGRVEIDIPQFTAHHDFVQIFDNPKQLYLATRSWTTAGGRTRFSTKMAAELRGGNPEDFRDGFAAFNVLDFESALVFDIVTNGHKVWAIYERLLIPGVTTETEAFTDVIDLGVATAGMCEHECEVEYDAKGDAVRYIVDGEEKLKITGVPARANQLTCGFGIITLHPIESGMSISCRGQGCKATWAAFFVPENP